MREQFRIIAHLISQAMGTAWAFTVAIAVVLLWAVTGPLFGFSDTWQLVINTGTTIVTFLMVFLIQNTQNRDAKAIHLKLDELIRAVAEARTGMVDLEDLTEEELDKFQKEFQRLREQKDCEPIDGNGDRRPAGKKDRAAPGPARPASADL